LAEAPEPLIEAVGGAVPIEIYKSRDYMFVYETEADIRAIKPDFNRLIDLGAHAIIVTAKGDKADFVSRFFAPELGVPEDPVTGSAHCTLIPYWAERLGKSEMFALQVSSRGGELYCELRGDRVKIGGNATLFLKGEIYVEAGEQIGVGA
jgi:predicted PhzF superfamily epimerase YddE/YHI9